MRLQVVDVRSRFKVGMDDSRQKSKNRRTVQVSSVAEFVCYSGQLALRVTKKPRGRLEALGRQGPIGLHINLVDITSTRMLLNITFTRLLDRRSHGMLWQNEK